jgi:hypothetical protein
MVGAPACYQLIHANKLHVKTETSIINSDD